MAKISIKQNGSSGTVQYIEGWLKKNVCEFYWEFGGGKTVATIWFPAEDSAWQAKYPWGAGRRMEIVKEMAEQVRLKQAPSSRCEWEADRVHLISA